MKAFVFLTLLVFLPQIALGAERSGLVTCTGVDCNFCTFIQMVDNIVDWLFMFLVLAAVLILVYAGFKLVVSAGNPSAMSAAKGYISNVIIGFVIVMAGWLIVDTLMKALVGSGSDFGTWNEIKDCGGINFNEVLQP